MRREDFINWFEERFALTKNDIYEFGQLYDEATKPHWISVEEELPKEGECKGELYVLYTEPLNENYSYEGRYRIGEYDGDTSKLYIVANNRWKIYGDKWNNTRVTHWMRLPQPPKGDEK